jgi:hypothetical protein
MSSVLDIKNVEPDVKRDHPPVAHHVLPQHAFSMLIVAPKGSGKTNLICHLILHQYKKYFHRIIVCSPTLDNDPKWEKVKKTPHILVENKKLEQIIEGRSQNKKKWKVIFENPSKEERRPDEDKFKGYIDEDDMFAEQSNLFPILEDQQNMMHFVKEQKGHEEDAKYIVDRMLIILDDQAGLFKMSNSHNPIMNFVIKHRHYSASIIIVTQAFKAIPKTIRTNCNALILFDIGSTAELKSIYEEFNEGLDEKTWMALYRECTKEPFQFYYSNNKFPKGSRVYKGFKTMMLIEQQ